MTIDENWEDVKIYYIRVTTIDNDNFSRTIVANATWSKEKVERLAKTKLPNIKTIEYIDEVENAWLPKEAISNYELPRLSGLGN